jgi:hypothetical protein
MATARYGHAATLLNDGKVLVTGGQGTNGPTSPNAELFDPASGTFTPTGSMAVARVSHTATLLNDGKVLVMGGGNTSAELFDPVTGMFSPTGSLETTRSGHAATLLSDGRVLVTGGDPTLPLPGENKSPQATAEIFDPATGNFTLTGEMETQRFGHTATLLKDGKVLVVGGSAPFLVLIGTNISIYTESIQTAELFDPSIGSFTSTGSMQTRRTAHAATLLNDGTVLVSGGADINFQNGVSSDTALSMSERFDPAQGAFVPSGSMATPRTGHSATLRNDGTVLVAGGSSVVGRVPRGGVLVQSLGTAELFDPKSSTFTQTGGMKTPRSGHTATLLQDDRVLVIGGADFTAQSGKQSSTVLSAAELYQ